MKCEKCNVEMISGIAISISYGRGLAFLPKDNVTPLSKFLGWQIGKNATQIKAESCPNCKKVELFLVN